MALGFQNPLYVMESPPNNIINLYMFKSTHNSTKETNLINVNLFRSHKKLRMSLLPSAQDLPPTLILSLLGSFWAQVFPRNNHEFTLGLRGSMTVNEENENMKDLNRRGLNMNLMFMWERIF